MHTNDTILIVLSGADHWTRTDGSQYATGYWAEEFVVIHQKFIQAGYQVELASPGGVKPTADWRSLDPQYGGPEAPRYAAYLEEIAASLAHPLRLADVDMGRYVAVVIPGGHGPAEDLYHDADMARVLFEAARTDKVIGSVCHGPAALLSAVNEDGSWLFAGRRLTGFSDEEEVEFGTAENAPWLLATRMRELGARYERGPQNWAPFAITDGKLVTGQNPASSAATADGVLAVLAGAGR